MFTGSISREARLIVQQALEFGAISEDDIELDEITFIFAPQAKRNFDNLFDALDKIGMEEDKHQLVFGKVDTFVDVMTEVKKRYGIKSRSVAMIKMCEICRDHLADDSEQG